MLNYKMVKILQLGELLTAPCWKRTLRMSGHTVVNINVTDVITTK